MVSRSLMWRLAAAVLALALCASAGAQTQLLQELRTVASGAAPVEHTIGIQAAGAYRLTLTDLKTPAALTSVKLAVTSDTAVLGTTATTATNSTGILDFTAAAAGTYTIRVVGKPATAATGAVTVSVVRQSDSKEIEQFAATFSPPPPAVAPNRGTLNTTITLASAGTYQVTLSDLAVPQAIPNLILAVVPVGSAPVVTLNAAGSAQFAGTAGKQYVVVADGMASTSVNAGAFGVRIWNTATHETVLSQIVTIGSVAELGRATLAAGTHTLSLTDFNFPAALTQVSVGVAFDGAVVSPPLTGTGSVNFNASAGEHVLYGVAVAAAASSGTYSVELRPQGGAPVFSTVKAVNSTSTSPTGVAGYTFVVEVPSAGAYRVRLADFVFPSALTAVRLAASQSGALLGSIDAAGTLNLANVAAGRLFLVVLAQPGTVGGLFGVDVAPGGGGANLFEKTQGVGILSTSRTLTVPAAAKYRVKVSDLQFPAAFTQLSTIVTRGADASAAIFGSDQFDFDGAPGDYLINFIAQVDATEQAGTYGLNVAQLPPAPTVSLTAPAQATVGNTVTLTWSSTNATACTASGGWSGSKTTSGSESSAPITSSTSFTLRCDGASGSATQTVTVSAVTPARSGGGGGALGWTEPVALALALFLASRRRRRGGF